MFTRATAGAALLATGLLITGACGGGGASYDNIGEVFEAVAQVTCEKLDECNQLDDTTVDECVDGLVDLLCGDADVDCQDDIPDDISSSEINDCLDDLEDQECDDTTDPASCSKLE
jgi:hypothetical protein